MHPQPAHTHTHGAQQPSASAHRPAWTAERIRALGTVTTVPTAAAIFGLSRSVAYDLIKTGTFPLPVLRFGRRYRIPVTAILTALHMPTEPDPPTT
ncbi:helix-turn-helix domain-containing protein [Dactylosporangium sp. CA-152071]|uniref:helix-turn-helix domain-containing protein n=1 Tax=Dactylosporangium sp. CA-152071 TaxID=3239933 RepID=UPI003D8F55FB